MKLGNIELQNPLFLAPMAGVTDWAFRTVCFVCRFASGAWKKKAMKTPG